MNSQFMTPFGDFTLKRVPDSDKNLFAWNSADHYMLNHLFDLFQSGEIDLNKKKILIVNDAFGALSVPLAQFSCDSYGDSFISHEAIIRNMKRCCPENLDKITLIKSTEQLKCKYDVVLFKEVKNQAFFQDQMLQITQKLSSRPLIIGGVMARNLQKNTVNLLNKSIGLTQPSLAWKKARLLLVNSDVTDSDKVKDKYFQEYNKVTTYQLDKTNYTIYNNENVF
ncbi:MAG: hypothetical protein KZQ74_01075, partial [gamma proteobacterium symbiont of Bathyaustriella thionipta]|nr:hypothetical protein [gamma proteobacterium symbiont of Bathyaustriella thionipta]